MEKSFLEPLMPLCQNMVFRGVSVLLGVNNTSVNVGHYNSVIVEAWKNHTILVGCSCWIANTTKKVIYAFSKINHVSIQ